VFQVDAFLARREAQQPEAQEDVGERMPAFFKRFDQVELVESGECLCIDDAEPRLWRRRYSSAKIRPPSRASAIRSAR
jgi:hypothetical protein